MQRATVKLLTRDSKKNHLGQVPIYLRTTVNRKSSYISTGYYIQPKHWDERSEGVKESHPLHAEINLDITNKKKKILQELIDASIKNRHLSAKGVKENVSKELFDIYKFTEVYSKELKGKRAGTTIDNYEKHMRKLKEFAGASLSFHEIDADFLRSFETYLRNGGVKNRKHADPSNYIGALMRTIRTMFNVAISRGITQHYPFTQYEMPDEKPGNKSYLTLAEVKRWHQFAMETTHPTLSQVAVYFLFACYTGLRQSDWKDFAEAKIKAGNISVQATKNKEWVAVPLHQGHIELFRRMKEVPLTVQEPTINRNLKEVAKYLKINKSLSTHCGRKTFAVTMCLERGISAETAAKLMGITLAVFEKNYSVISPDKIRLETAKAWDGLFS